MTSKRELGIEVAPRRHKDIVDRHMVRDSRLSYRALGLGLRLLSNQAGFTMTSIDLARDRPEGRDAIRSALKELETYGYLSRRRVQRPNGQWMTKMFITDEPSPTPENPSSVPTPEKPAPGKPALGAPGPKSSKSSTSKSSTRKNTTTTTTTGTYLIWPPGLPQAQVVVVKKVIQGLDRMAQQQLLDELAGALLGSSPPRQLASWMRALRRRQQHGEFIPDLGLRVEHERARRAEDAAKQQERDEEARRLRSPEVRARSTAASQAAIAELQRQFAMSSDPIPREQRR